jgi:hypothetical protein
MWAAAGICGGLVGCYTPSGEYGGVYTQDYSGPYGLTNQVVVKSEQVGTAFGPWGGMYNYEEVNFGPANSNP